MIQEDAGVIAGAILATLIWWFIGLFVIGNISLSTKYETECRVRAEYATTLADSVAFASKIEGCPNLLFGEKSR